MSDPICVVRLATFIISLQSEVSVNAAHMDPRINRENCEELSLKCLQFVSLPHIASALNQMIKVTAQWIVGRTDLIFVC